MSTMIVKTYVIDNILSVYFNEDIPPKYLKKLDLTFGLLRLKRIMKSSFNAEKELEHIGQQLYDLNIKSFINYTSFTDVKRKYEFNVSCCSLVQSLKHLNTLMNECKHAENLEENDIYQMMKALQLLLKDIIIFQSDEYINAAWY